MGRGAVAGAREAGHAVGVVLTSTDAGSGPGELAAALRGHDVVIDFSVADAVPAHVAACAQAGVPLVEGTTGWQAREADLRRVVEDAGGAMVYGPNFSVGGNLFYRVVENAAGLVRGLPAYDAFIEEAHHVRKRDAPSGTALQLRKILARELGGGRDIAIASTRAGHIPGVHRVGFDSAADQITLVHTARSRDGFAAGAPAAARRLPGRRGGAARATGADAVLVVAPYYNKPTQAGLTAHFTAVAAAVPGVPVVLYNVPGRTASNIQAPTVLGLARDVENIVGVKEASGDFAQIMAILRDRPQGFRVLSGDDAVTLPLVALGADGIVSVVSNEVPDLMARLSDLALQGKWDEARALHYRLLPLMEGNFIESNPGPVKAAMALQGLLEETYRLPLVPVQEKTRARLRELLTELGLLGKPRHVAA